MQFAKRFPFDVNFKVAKLQGDSLSQNLTPGCSVECRLKLRSPQATPGSDGSPGGSSCEVLLACKCGDSVGFAYVEAHMSGGWERQNCVDGLVQRFDTACSERPLGRVPLPTIGRGARFLAANLRLSGQLLLEEGCGPDAFAPDGISDVRLLVEGRELHLHRSLLAKASPVFRAMLLGCFREGAQQDAAVELPGKGLSQFLELLATVYPPQLEMHSGRAKSLLPLLTEYQMEHLAQRCERALLQSPLYEMCRDACEVGLKLPQPWTEELLDHAYLATVYQLKELQEKSVSLLASVQLTPGGQQEALKDLLPDEILCRVFAKRVSLLEGKIGRLTEELDGYRGKLEANSEA